MKKRLLAILCASLMLLAGCVPKIDTGDKSEQIYASFFPIYALTGIIVEDIPELNVKCLIQPQDDCLRLYDLSDWDASVLAYDADAVVIGGNGLESFESALYTFGDEGPAIITATYALDLYNQNGEFAIEGETGHLYDANPHLYMSVGGARRMIGVIAPALCELYPEYTEQIVEGYEKSDSKLAALEDEMAAICSGVTNEPVILMNEALIYTALDYHLNVVYRYDRESGTTLYGQGLDEALKAFDETGVKVILIEKQAPTELTYSLKEAGYTVVLIDTLNSYPSDAAPDYYIDAQLANAKAIAAAFDK